MTALDVFQTIGSVIGLPAVVVALILFLLNRKGANKKLELEETAVGVTVTEQQLGSYRDMLDRQNTQLEKAVEKVTALESRVDDLETADAAKSEELDSANTKIELLRKLFTSYIDRTGVPLTPDEQEIFDRTIPSPRLRRNQ